MTPEQLSFHRDLLIEKLEGLLGTAGKTIEELTKDDDSFPDPVDRAMSESSISIVLRKSDRERKFIQKIRSALKKIQDGSYGECEDCSDEISGERLRARPEATLCINCKEEQETMEKQFGK
ncbi:MAG: RNA polymerase-binding protein DksA [Candidatus Dadabacteria bacterium]|nr:RNA polymerase-binding protein DksA [Candidatus Dadabacteria bacterium]